MRILRVSLLSLFFLFAVAARAQFSPDPGEPDAAGKAAFFFIGSIIGLTPPPVGWDCVGLPLTEDGIPQGVLCVPDQAMLEAQAAERETWMIEQRERMQKNWERIFRKRR